MKGMKRKFFLKRMWNFVVVMLIPALLLVAVTTYMTFVTQMHRCDTKSRNVLCINTALSIWSNPTVTCTGQKPALGSSQDNMGNLPA